MGVSFDKEPNNLFSKSDSTIPTDPTVPNKTKPLNTTSSEELIKIFTRNNTGENNPFNNIKLPNSNFSKHTDPNSYSIGWTVEYDSQGNQTCYELRHFSNRTNPDKIQYPCDGKTPYQVDQEKKQNPSN
jgi:hypothetical protein